MFLINVHLRFFCWKRFKCFSWKLNARGRLQRAMLPKQRLIPIWKIRRDLIFQIGLHYFIMSPRSVGEILLWTLAASVPVCPLQEAHNGFMVPNSEGWIRHSISQSIMSFLRRDELFTNLYKKYLSFTDNTIMSLVESSTFLSKIFKEKSHESMRAQRKTKGVLLFCLLQKSNNFARRGTKSCTDIVE